MSYKFKKDERAYHRKWYRKNRKHRIRQIKRWQRQQMGMVSKYKLEKGCKQCGYKKCARALDFHHKDENKKDFILSAKRMGWSFKTLLKEIKKCDVLCKNCHTELHADVAQLG